MIALETLKRNQTNQYSLLRIDDDGSESVLFRASFPKDGCYTVDFPPNIRPPEIDYTYEVEEIDGIQTQRYGDVYFLGVRV